MRKILSSVCVLLVNGFVSAENLQTEFDLANQDFYSKNYVSAIRKYESMLANGYVSSEIFSNLASAYFQNDEVGRSVLNFERAKFLSPRDKDVSANLNFVKKTAKLNSYESLASMRAHELSFNEWCIITSALGLAFVYLLFIPNLFFWNVSIRNGLWALWFVFKLVAVFGIKITSKDFDKVVFVALNSEIKVAPASSSPVMKAVNAGECAYVKDVHGDLVLVEAEGFSGWTLKNNVEYVVVK